MKLDAIGDAVARTGLASSSFHLDGGFVGAHPPAGEVAGLVFADRITLVWHPEKSIGAYNLYRDLLSSLAGFFLNSGFYEFDSHSLEQLKEAIRRALEDGEVLQQEAQQQFQEQWDNMTPEQMRMPLGLSMYAAKTSSYWTNSTVPIFLGNPETSRAANPCLLSMR